MKDKHMYHIIYVGDKNELLSFDVKASSWEELKRNVDNNLPKNVKYILGIYYVKTSYSKIE